jgi:hypothetical protein
MTVKQVSLSYLEARERFVRALARLKHYEEELRLLLGAADTGADLETKMLEARTKGEHTEAISKLHTLGTALDQAGDALDLATELQRRRVAEQRAGFDASFQHLEF